MLITLNQFEFDFVKPYNDADEAAKLEDNKRWNDMFNCIARLLPKDFHSIMDSLFDSQPMNTSSSEMFSIPMTVVVGERNQLIFPFMRKIYEGYWGLPVKFHSDIH